MGDIRQILEKVHAEAGFAADELDVSEMEGYLPGIVIQGGAVYRSIIESFQSVYQFDAIESEGKLKYRPRGNASVATIPADDLLPINGSGELKQYVQVTRLQDLELPDMMELAYIDRDVDYQAGLQHAVRQTARNTTKASINTPFVMTPNLAKIMIDTVLDVAWRERYKLHFRVPFDYAYLEQGDVVTLTLANRTWLVRILKITMQEMGYAIQAVSTSSHDYSQSNRGTDGTSYTTVQVPQLSTLFMLNVPLAPDSTPGEAAYYYAVAKANGDNAWRFARLYHSADNSDFTLKSSTNSSAIAGTADTELAAGDHYEWDDASTVQVTLVSGSLSSVTDLEMLNGANMAMLGDEVFQFGVATLNSGTTYTLSHLLRGRRGTEWACSEHAIGDVFVLLQEATAIRVPMVITERDQERHYKAVANGQIVENIPSQAFTPNAVNLRPFSPCNIEATRDDDDGDIHLTWFRRTRINGGWMGGIEVPLGEEAEAYEIDIMDGADVVQTLTSDDTSTTYTAARQVADFGGLQSSITVHVYQMGASYGRGTPGIATV